MSTPSYGVYHGDEDWVLKGIGQDIATALSHTYNVQVQSTDQVFKGKRLNTDYHIFVQQGQLNSNCKFHHQLPPSNTICLFTHLDTSNFSPKILSQCKAVIFNSSIQLSMAIANGYIPNNAILFPHAVDPSLHQILPPSHPNFVALQHSLSQQNKSFIQHGAVGFCGRYWEKFTYTRRKNYTKIKKVAYNLADSGIPVVILGPGWNKLFTRSHPLISLITTKYSNYPLVYNLMKVFVSLSIHEGGPLPVLESMCCGAYPIITNTGFAFDVLKGCHYGDLIDAFYSISHLTDLISKRFYAESWDKHNIRDHASQFSFDKLASKILSIR